MGSAHWYVQLEARTSSMATYGHPSSNLLHSSNRFHPFQEGPLGIGKATKRRPINFSMEKSWLRVLWLLPDWLCGGAGLHRDAAVFTWETSQTAKSLREHCVGSWKCLVT